MVRVVLTRNEDSTMPISVQSQLEISDIAKMVHPRKRGHRIVAVLQFKFDESYDQRFMSVAGFIADELEWKKLEEE
jgi:hypothetical protein